MRMKIEKSCLMCISMVGEGPGNDHFLCHVKGMCPADLPQEEKEDLLAKAKRAFLLGHNVEDDRICL